MTYYLLWIFLLILQALVSSLPTQNRYDISAIGIDPQPGNTSPESPRYEDTSESGNEQVISVRITSSVAVGRRKEKVPYTPRQHQYEPDKIDSPATSSTTTSTELAPLLSSSLIGANVEYIKQLIAKKDARDHHTDQIHPFQLMMHGQHSLDNESSLSKSTKINEYGEDFNNVPTARKVSSISNENHFHEHKGSHDYPLSVVDTPMTYYNQNSQLNLTTEELSSPSKLGIKINLDNNENDNCTVVAKKKELRDLNPFISNSNNYQTDDSVAESSIKSVGFAKTMVTVPPSTSYIHNRRLIDNHNDPRLTTVTFNVVHDETKTPNNNEPNDSYLATSQVVPQQQFYSEPAKFYSEPAKFYSEPAKIYSEPAKIYSEPAKVYSEPAKIYSEPSKFYSEPASLHLNENISKVPPSVPPNYSPWQSQHSISGGTTINTTPIATITTGYQTGQQMEHQPERNYEVDEKISVLTDGRSHGIQESSTEKCKQDNCKVGYVVEGRQYKKYRVEERTADGFIVGEYGVVRNEDGALRGVRYTADGDASPRLIHDALMKFLQLK